MDTGEVEFIAECYKIDIVPKFNQAMIHLISGDIGPFIAGHPHSVPLWVALNLRQRQKCRLLPPSWMSVGELERIKQEEKESAIFVEMPSPQYREITQMILDIASSDIPQADRVQTLVKDIWDMRLAKLRASVDVFIRSDQVHAQVDHLTVMELNTVRPVLLNSLKHISKLHKVPTGNNSSVNDSAASVSVTMTDSTLSSERS